MIYGFQTAITWLCKFQGLKDPSVTIVHFQQLYIIFKVASIKTNIHFTSMTTVVSNKSDRNVIFCLQLLSKIFTCKFHLS